jgi:hypothetical protein
MSDLPDKPHHGFFAWLGRQVGYVARAVKTDVGKKTIYRNNSVEELPHPADPNLKLRRTVIDEVIDERPGSK